MGSFGLLDGYNLNIPSSLSHILGNKKESAIHSFVTFIMTSLILSVFIIWEIKEENSNAGHRFADLMYILRFKEKMLIFQ